MSNSIEIKKIEFTKKEENSPKSDKNSNSGETNKNNNSSVNSRDRKDLTSSKEEKEKGEEEESEGNSEENIFCDENECRKNDRDKYEKCEFRVKVKKEVKNDSGDLKKKLKKKYEDEELENEDLEDKGNYEKMELEGYSIAAHHTIPGNQVFKELDEIVQLTQGVGYNINCAENGIFLPSNEPKLGEAPTNTHKNAKAFEVMEKLGAQWHSGGHSYTIEEKDLEKYPELEKMEDYAVAVKNYVENKFCVDRYKKKCRESEEEKKRIIEKMNRISSDIKKKLLDFKKNPKESHPYFVSKLAMFYAYKIPETVKVIIMRLEEKKIHSQEYRVKRKKEIDKLIFNEKESLSINLENLDELLKLSEYCSNICYFILLGDESEKIENFLLDEDYKLTLENSREKIGKILDENQDKIKIFLKENPYETKYIKETVVKRKKKFKKNFGIDMGE